MAQVYLIGQVTAKLELRRSERNVPYIRFGLMETMGYGERASRQFYQIWAFGPDAERLAKQNVGKGSLMWVSGSLFLVDYLKRDGITRDKVLKVTFQDGGCISGLPAGTAAAKPVGPAYPPRIDGERDPLPE